jgi:hypothetical protein
MSKGFVHVVCHDGVNVVAGAITKLFDRGCEITAIDAPSGQLFPKGARIVMNLLDEGSGRSTNSRVQLTSVLRRDGNWVYKVRWGRVPELLQDAGTKA